MNLATTLNSLLVAFEEAIRDDAVNPSYARKMRVADLKIKIITTTEYFENTLSGIAGDARREMYKFQRFYDSTCREKHRLARLVDQCRTALTAVATEQTYAYKLVKDRLDRCDDYIHCKPERECSPKTDAELPNK